MAPEPPEDLDLFLEVVLVSHFMQQLVRREFEAEGLDFYMFGLLVHVHHRGTVTPSQLAEETQVTNTTIRDQVQNLVDRGLLSRRANPDDARSYLLELTTEGKRFHARGSRAHERARKRLVRELGRPLAEIQSTVVELRRAAARALAEQ
jgi:DNA-binding MarR family transcriptional regulator